MAELVTVYWARPSEVAKVVGFLRGRNLDPVVLDDAGKMGAYRDHSHEVRIAVPETQRSVALGVLKEMEQKDEARLAPLIGETNRIMRIILLCMIALGLAAVVPLLGKNGKWLAAVWLVLIAVVAIALIRSAWRRSSRL